MYLNYLVLLIITQTSTTVHLTVLWYIDALQGYREKQSKNMFEM